MNSQTDMKFRTFSDIWFEEYAMKKFTAGSVLKYPPMLTIVNKGIGNISLSRMTPQVILDFCIGLKKKSVGTARLKVDFSELLSQKGTTRAEIQKKSDVAPSTMVAFTRNKKISEESARVFAKTLKMPFDDLFEADEPKAVSFGTARNYLSLIRSILEFAVERGIIKFNVAKSVDLNRRPVTAMSSKDKEGIADEDNGDS